jgi:hypothetical protein
VELQVLASYKNKVFPFYFIFQVVFVIVYVNLLVHFAINYNAKICDVKNDT